MSAYKQDSVWRFRKSIRLPNGTRERISGTPNQNSKAAAEEAERQAIDKVEHPERYPTAPVVPNAPVGFSTFAKEWLSIHPPAANTKSTQDYREQHLRMHLLPYFLEMPLSEIDAMRLVKLVGDLKNTKLRRGTTGPRKRKTTDALDRNRPLTHQTVRHILGTLHKILKDAVTWKKLVVLPEFPKIKVPKAPWDWLRPEETLRLMLGIDDPEEKAKILFAWKTGCRIGEQLAVRWADIDFAAGAVTFKQAFYKGSLGPLKTTGSWRTVELSPSVIKALRAIQHLRGKYVFCDVDGKPYTNAHFKAILKRHLRRVGLRKIRWHDLRHTFASQLVTLGVNLKYVQEKLGHTTMLMTLRYAHLGPSTGAEVALLDKAG